MTRTRGRSATVAMFVASAAALTMAAGADQSAAESRTLGPGTTAKTASIVAVGDIACQRDWPGFNKGNGRGDDCRQRYTAQTTAALDPDAVLALGDNQYELGQFKDFRSVFARTWGRFLDRSDPENNRLWPVPGNHEYGKGEPGYHQAPGYWTYFNGGTLKKPHKNGVAGKTHRGWYRRDIGAWTVLALNANCPYLPHGCSRKSRQYRWLRHQLRADPTQCTLAYWHQPLFTHGQEPAAANTKPFWRLLTKHKSEVVLNGHAHDYERFPPLDAKGNPDATGLTEFVVGTGGHSLVPFAKKPSQPDTVTRSRTTTGVLHLTLSADSFEWQFVRADYPGNGTFTDSGSAQCH